MQAALTAYRAAWRAKMDEVNQCIKANAEQEELVDQPEKVPGVDQVIGRLCDAIQPDTDCGESPLLPVIDRFSPNGTTADVIFNTTRPCHSTLKSHIDHVVLDTDTWERSASFTLEASEHVAFYARNDDGGHSHLGFGIPYDFYGQAHLYYPDFLVRLTNGVTLILEIKGMLGDQGEQKHEAAKRWVSAVNNWSRMGRWQFSLTAEKTPYLARLENFTIDELVPSKLIRRLILELDDSSTDDDVLETLQEVKNADVENFLFDLISFIRSGDLLAAEARIKLRNGLTIPVGDAGTLAGEAVSSAVNSDQVVVVNDLSREELERLLDPRNFHEWMVFLHPDQRSLAYGSYDRPVVLKGVSGSGKTCILVHRARYLARKFPGERIGILTLSKTLAGLLKNLVAQLCSEEERKCIEVLPFYEVFRECLKHLGLEKYFAQLTQLAPDIGTLKSAMETVRKAWPKGMVWDCDPIGQHRVEEQWEDFLMSQDPDLKSWMQGLERYLVDNWIDAERYIEEEFTLIRSAFPVPARNDYLSYTRTGRSVVFKEEHRKDMLRLLLFWEEWLLAGGMIDALGLTQALMRYMLKCNNYQAPSSSAAFSSMSSKIFPPWTCNSFAESCRSIGPTRYSLPATPCNGFSSSASL